ncbi:MAG: hypothetical protein IJC63_08730 [Myxococcaceae bacterium]|nr:hypothetical protein [Myxococcaceae bacterium]
MKASGIEPRKLIKTNAAAPIHLSTFNTPVLFSDCNDENHLTACLAGVTKPKIIIQQNDNKTPQTKIPELALEFSLFCRQLTRAF